MDVVLFIKLARTDYRDLTKYLINYLRGDDLSLSEYFPIKSDENVVDYQSVIAFKYTKDTILLFPNVKSAKLFHKYIMIDQGHDNFIKYCLTGNSISKSEMKENRIKGILTIDSVEIANIIYNTIINGDFKDAEISQKLITCDEL
jgi:hypothetical protein